MMEEKLSDKAARQCAEALAQRVAPIYELLNWNWSSIGKVPGKDDIARTLLKLYEDLQAEPLGAADFIGTGGLEVHRYIDEEGTVDFIFKFSIEKHLEWYLSH